jgi:hypothetical protein
VQLDTLALGDSQYPSTSGTKEDITNSVMEPIKEGQDPSIEQLAAFNAAISSSTQIQNETVENEDGIACPSPSPCPCPPPLKLQPGLHDGGGDSDSGGSSRTQAKASNTTARQVELNMKRYNCSDAVSNQKEQSHLQFKYAATPLFLHQLLRYCAPRRHPTILLNKRFHPSYHSFQPSSVLVF